MLYSLSARSTAVRHFEPSASKTVKVLRCLIRLMFLHLPRSHTLADVDMHAAPNYTSASAHPTSTSTAFPDTILVRFEDSSDGFVGADLAHLRKYPPHIPRGADGAFVKADLEGGRQR
jgi:hypothetical protein